MSAVTWLDDQIIDRIYQPIVNTFELDIQAVSRYCLIGTIVFNVYSAYLQISHYHNWTDVATRMVGIGFVLMVYFQPRPASTGANPFRSSLAFLLVRYVMLLVLVLTIYKLIKFPEVLYANDLLGGLVYSSFWFFMSCVKPPPKAQTYWGAVTG